jgi:serine-type D-Ala-D-Ala carboxypeptidase/endopeptidase (penicillin-binding protein 4)
MEAMKFLILALFFVLTPLYSQELKEDISPWLKKMASRYSIDSDFISWSLKEVGSPTEFFGHEQDRQVIPASLTKILTVWHALNKLGDDYRFETEIFANGKIKDGVLEGDLILKGAGDPFFTNAMLMNMAIKLKNKGITKVKGRFLYDQSTLPVIPMISTIGLGDQTYNPGVSALSLEFNRFTVWRGNHTIPPLHSLKVMKLREKFTPGRRFKELDGDSSMEVWGLSENEKYQLLEEVPIRKPALIFAETFRMIAAKTGVELPKAVEGKASGKKIVTQFSQPLSLLSKSIMEYSNNLMAELILLASTKAHPLEPAAKEMQEVLTKKFNFLSSINLKNGSGLDSQNRMTPKALTAFLAENFPKEFGETAYPSLFSISGQSGWMLRRLNDPEMSYNVWAKTGSLDYIDNMAGYLFAKSGKIYAFSVFINDMKKRDLLDGLNSEKINQLREKAKDWRNQSKPLTDALIRHWFETL